MVGRRCFFTPNKAIKAKMPPSPSLPTRMANETYLMVVTMRSVHSTSERAPRTVPAAEAGSAGAEWSLTYRSGWFRYCRTQYQVATEPKDYTSPLGAFCATVRQAG